MKIFLRSPLEYMDKELFMKSAFDISLWLVDDYISPYDALNNIRDKNIDKYEPDAYLSMYFIGYLYNVLRWIPTKPIGDFPWAGYGFTMAGAVTIDAKACILLERACNTLADLFIQGGEKLLLEVPMESFLYRDADAWNISLYTFSRDEIVLNLRKIEKMGIIAQKEKKYILQYGL
jgi:hypothetical protein